MHLLPLALTVLMIVSAPGSHAAGTQAWKPFEPVTAPPVPNGIAVPGGEVAAHPVDVFILEALQSKGLQLRPPAEPEVLLRRVHLDLTGLAPTPEERAEFLRDPSPAAYEALVDRLLADPRHAERWARHWMDIWRYSDWAGWNDGGQIRDSQPHIWRWRDWIVESLAADTGYDAMLVDMLAADERAPADPQALRATGFLARNYKMLSREQWLEDTVNHTGMAFMGLTVGCAKCHDHRQDPLSQKAYFALRAIFEPHHVRLDPLPGSADPAKQGLARVYDSDPGAPTWFLPRGDERKADKSQPIAPGVPEFLGGTLEVNPVDLPAPAVFPLKQEFVREALLAEAQTSAKSATAEAPLAVAKLRSLEATLAYERLVDAGKQEEKEGKEAAATAVAAQREEAVQTALRKVVTATQAKQKAEETKGDTAAATTALEEARKVFDQALIAAAGPVTVAPAPRFMPAYPARSSGRRLAFARWLTRPDHPLTARVAVNHVWTRHFGQGLVRTVADFGKGGAAPTHPALLDWLAADFMKHGWSLRHLHRTLCLSAVYRQSSSPGPQPAGPRRIDPDNQFYWHYPARRLEAEAVRDNILYLTGGLDLARGGPDLDHREAMTVRRRSLYLRCAAEKQPEFLQVFDGPGVVECYERKPSVMPQQALALLNSSLTHERAAAAAEAWKSEADAAFVGRAFQNLLTRDPKPEELQLCLEFLQSQPSRARPQLILTLLNHHEFITLR